MQKRECNMRVSVSGVGCRASRTDCCLLLSLGCIMRVCLATTALPPNLSASGSMWTTCQWSCCQSCCETATSLHSACQHTQTDQLVSVVASLKRSPWQCMSVTTSGHLAYQPSHNLFGHTLHLFEVTASFQLKDSTSSLKTLKGTG